MALKPAYLTLGNTGALFSSCYSAEVSWRAPKNVHYISCEPVWSWSQLSCHFYCKIFRLSCDFLFSFPVCRSFSKQGDAISRHAALASGNPLQRQQPLLQTSDTGRVPGHRRQLQRLNVSGQKRGFYSEKLLIFIKLLKRACGFIFY